MESPLDPVSRQRLKVLTRSELEHLFEGEQELRLQLQNQLDEIKQRYTELEDTKLNLLGQFVRLKSKLFGRSSEKSPRPTPSDKTKADKSDEKKPKSDTTKKPSERYPNAPIIEHELKLENNPSCRQCGGDMRETSLQEVSEYLSVVPRRYTIIRQVRAKYRCSCCHGDIQTTPGLPRIKPGSCYSDEMILDVAMSKYCDLIPVERYAQMAAREGFEGLAPNSLILATHHLADFVKGAYFKLKEEILAAPVLQADETPHRMLEGDEKSRWFMWGFSTKTACYFECHATRSGDVASEFLKNSLARVLLTDVYSGYGKTIRIINGLREQAGKFLLIAAHCNAHARRKFKEAKEDFSEQASFYLDLYKEIYRLEKEGLENQSLSEARVQMRAHFKKMLAQGLIDLPTVSEKSSLATAIKYLSKNYSGLTIFLDHLDVPIDNNSQERALRNPVVGRKTWYGTHSIKGAETAARLFSLVESCKINKLNPRKYFNELVKELHNGSPPFTPAEYKLRDKIVQETEVNLTTALQN